MVSVVCAILSTMMLDRLGDAGDVLDPGALEENSLETAQGGLGMPAVAMRSQSPLLFTKLATMDIYLQLSDHSG